MKTELEKCFVRLHLSLWFNYRVVSRARRPLKVVIKRLQFKQPQKQPQISNADAHLVCGNPVNYTKGSSEAHLGEQQQQQQQP